MIRPGPGRRLFLAAEAFCRDRGYVIDRRPLANIMIDATRDGESTTLNLCTMVLEIEMIDTGGRRKRKKTEAV